MKNTLLILYLLLSGHNIFAQNKSSIYLETIEKFKRFYNNNQADSLFALYSPEIKTSSPLAKTKEQLLTLQQRLGKLNRVTKLQETDRNITYTGEFEQSKLNIIIAVNDQKELSSLTFLPIQEKLEEEKIITVKEISNFNIETDKGSSIYGTLVMPEKARKNVPVVLFISGTGQTNRNGNSGIGAGTNSLKMLADSLKKAGIASVRYDKRGVGESSKAIKSEAELSFDDLVTDAVSFVRKIRKNKKFGNVYIAGHSEGALIAMIAANKEEVDGVITIAANGEPADVIVRRQITKNIPDKAMGIDSIISEIKAGRKVKIENRYLVNIFKPSIQRYLSSLYAYHPQKEIGKLKIPVLILQGKQDLQVSVQDAELLKSANNNAELILLPEMNYVLKDVGDNRNDNIATYNNPTLPVSSALSHELIRFCK